MEWTRKPCYADPDLVAETMGLPDRNDPLSLFRFSDMSNPSYNYVNHLIMASEDVIDRRLQRSWRENRVVNHITTARDYYADRNSVYRAEYWAHGGNMVQLHKSLRPIDPLEGDRIEIRTRSGEWRDVTDEPDPNAPLDPYTGAPGRAWWCDPESGRLFIRMSRFVVRDSSIRVTYRWGSEEPVPEAIRRLCCLMTAGKVIEQGFYDIKTGLGGDVANTREQLLTRWDREIGEIFTSYQRAGSVYSLLR